MRIGPLFEPIPISCKVLACIRMSLHAEIIVTIWDICTDDIDMLFLAVLLEVTVPIFKVATNYIVHFYNDSPFKILLKNVCYNQTKMFMIVTKEDSWTMCLNEALLVRLLSMWTTATPSSLPRLQLNLSPFISLSPLYSPGCGLFMTEAVASCYRAHGSDSLCF